MIPGKIPSEPNVVPKQDRQHPASSERRCWLLFSKRDLNRRNRPFFKTTTQKFDKLHLAIKVPLVTLVVSRGQVVLTLVLDACYGTSLPRECKTREIEDIPYRTLFSINWLFSKLSNLIIKAGLHNDEKLYVPCKIVQFFL